MKQTKEPIVVIMAAGMGSRFGGMKQVELVGSNDEILMDFSIYDAIRAGFKRAVIIIKKEHQEIFEEVIGSRIAGHIELEYAYQEMDVLPEGYTYDGIRKKPWGTGHAIWCCKDVVDAPFVVLNADDYYGPQAFQEMYEYLSNIGDKESAYGMVAYILGNTLTDKGYVTRGVCEVSNGYLTKIKECKKIGFIGEGIVWMDGEQEVPLAASSVVSMNMWAFTEDIFDRLEQRFKHFLDTDYIVDKEKSEYLIPVVVGDLIHEEEQEVKVMNSYDCWYGVTYMEDKPMVVEAMKRLKDEEVYPERLWD